MSIVDKILKEAAVNAYGEMVEEYYGVEIPVDCMDKNYEWGITTLHNSKFEGDKSKNVKENMEDFFRLTNAPKHISDFLMSEEGLHSTPWYDYFTDNVASVSDRFEDDGFGYVDGVMKSHFGDEYETDVPKTFDDGDGIKMMVSKLGKDGKPTRDADMDDWENLERIKNHLTGDK